MTTILIITDPAWEGWSRGHFAGEGFQVEVGHNGDQIVNMFENQLVGPYLAIAFVGFGNKHESYFQIGTEEYLVDRFSGYCSAKD